MVLETIQGDILASKHKHIVFAVNTEGFNDAGFAGMVSYRFWPELANTGPQELGTVLTRVTDDHAFHAIVCHSLQSGWVEAPDIVRRYLDEMDVPEDEILGAVMMGGGFIGVMSGANPKAIMEAMDASERKLKVYHL